MPSGGGGVLKSGDPCLEYVDKIGTTHENMSIATGSGSDLALPLTR